MTWSVYALKSLKDGNLYIGLSSDPIRRVKEHNAGQCASTKGRGPFIMIYQEECGTSRIDARKREKYLKSGIGREFLKNIINPGV
ncbi:hypothetical protein A2773_04420 [Candidatus Gottesmanbacteria bacterium RIFCSPHIGHO2_01_FULL_39_10]|uniref:GIY-YIG domain-containing protein n=1 Tax=Candidatus Gottesmanbacteria bacterium RIFCSPHIGHO2_01_FULL_39_10 TaxID=1798375 RepID=A0A1F5ZSM7_9BACT|nr:MAG: hypothetical protein A2773_04420 [Candidatus Gottesmanbacteria bacterium RIFCSPHIGHO2_01_FULL_39_10]